MQLPALHLDPFRSSTPFRNATGFRLPQLLRDPKPHVRRARHQHGIGVRQIPVRQFITVARAEPAGEAACLSRPLRGYLKKRKRDQRPSTPARPRPPPPPPPARSEHTPCSGTGSPPAGHRDPCSPVQMRHRHADHKPRRAEPALAAMVCHHRLLHRMHLPSRPGNPSTVRTAFPCNCGRNRIQAFSALDPSSIRHHHGAGPAVALVAAFLGAGQDPAFRAASPDRVRVGGFPLDANRRSVQQKRYAHSSARRGLPMKALCVVARCGVKRSTRPLSVLSVHQARPADSRQEQTIREKAKQLPDSAEELTNPAPVRQADVKVRLPLLARRRRRRNNQLHQFQMDNSDFAYKQMDFPMDFATIVLKFACACSRRPLRPLGRRRLFIAVIIASA